MDEVAPMFESIAQNNFSLPEQLPGRILLVDDEALIRKSLQKFLEIKGYTADTAENGIQALEKLETSEYDLVITDLKMPGLDGRDLLRSMAEKFGNTPRIVLTAVGSNEDILLALKTGAYDFISKPILDYTLLNYTIQRALEHRKLNEDRCRTIEQMEKVNEVLSMLNRGLDTEEIFRSIDVSLKSVIPFNRMILFSFEQERSSLSVKLSSSDRKMVLQPDFSFKINGPLLEKLNERRDVYIINDINTFLLKNPRLEEINLLAQEGIMSCIIMELTFNEKNWGYLLFGSDERHAYNEDHQRFLRLIAGQLALGINRGELLTELEVHTKHLEHLVKVRTYEVLKTQNTTIFALSKLAETRDNETGNHLHRMRNYCIL
ncbi:MAG: response regulator, partial [Spirochaetota bacterium]